MVKILTFLLLLKYWNFSREKVEEEGKNQNLLSPVDLNLKKQSRDSPGGTEEKNPPAKSGDAGLIPGLGRFGATKAHVPHLLSPSTAATEACVPRACAAQEKPVQWEAMHCNDEWPQLTATRESNFVAVRSNKDPEQ